VAPCLGVEDKVPVPVLVGDQHFSRRRVPVSVETRRDS
jgi:hypothetical protein